MHLYGWHFGQISLLLLLSTSFFCLFFLSVSVHSNVYDIPQKIFQTRPHLHKEVYLVKIIVWFELFFALLALPPHHHRILVVGLATSIYESDFFCDCGFDIFPLVRSRITNTKWAFSIFLPFIITRHTRSKQVFYIFFYIL